MRARARAVGEGMAPTPPTERARRALVLLDGECAATPLLRSRVAGRTVIAADGGIRHAGPLGVVPDAWIGDFDSAEPDLRAAWPDVPRESHPPAKDWTDGELALRSAVSRGAWDILIAGALGGPRLDHALGTLMLGASVAGGDRQVVMTDGRHWVRPLSGPGTLEVPADEGRRLSLVGLSALEGLTLDGVRWTLANESVPFGASRTLSNEIEGDAARIALGTGQLLAVSGPGEGDALPIGHSAGASAPDRRHGP